MAEWYTPWHKRLKVGEELMADDIVQRLRGYADRSHLAIPSNLRQKQPTRSSGCGRRWSGMPTKATGRSV